ncbi:MAG: tRNA lysidine(34) synthetase TilS [Mariprofundaceae bacterium]|nr:tRNA lysidine(34) synthetase TilS [Mariprofundaceae bacterium]
MSDVPLLEDCQAWLDGSEISASMPAAVAVGWSGGADSTALLLALAGAGYNVQAWHVDHGWHEKSARESLQLARQAEAWGIPFHSVRLNHPRSANREAEAREGRYQAFSALSREQGLLSLCLAHHREDQAETVFMRLLQGAGAEGCRGMSPVRRHGELKIFRPLLHLSHSRLCSALRRSGVTWLEDASNSDTSLWRNRLRNRTFPAMQRAGVEPTDLFLRWQRQAVNVASEIGSQVDHLTLYQNRESCWVAWKEWQLLAPPMRVCLLKRMMRTLFGATAVPGRRHILLVESWMQHGGSGGLDLSRSRLMRKDGQLRLVRKT